MNKNLLILLIILVVLGGGAFLWYMGQAGTRSVPVDTATSETSMEEDGMEKAPLVISLSEQNDSGETGTATLTEVNGAVMVSISMVGSPVDVPQPAHIHTGSCANIGGVVYPLTFPENGESETLLQGVTFASLQQQLPLAVNIHKSTEEANVYTACGDLDL